VSGGVGDEVELRALAKAIVDSNRYLTLGTADGAGLPWVSPVWYAPEGYGSFFWVSAPEARHSRNIAVRPEVSIVIFDSHSPVGAGQAVYMAATAVRVGDAELTRGMELFSRRSTEQGAGEWTPADVRAPARLRLYRATALEHFVLSARDERIPVRLA
jgi:hypothetical protein